MLEKATLILIPILAYERVCFKFTSKCYVVYLPQAHYNRNRETGGVCFVPISAEFRAACEIFMLNDRYKGLLSDTLIFTISNFASKLLVFLLVPLYTTYLTTNEYGIADLLSNSIDLLYPILTLSIMEATLRFSFEKNNSDKVLINSIFIVGISCVLLVLIMPLIILIYPIFSEYWHMFLVMYLLFNVNLVLSQYVKGIDKTKTFAEAGVIQTFVMIFINIIALVIFNLGINGYLLAIIIGSFSSIVYMIYKIRLHFNIVRIDYKLLKEMLKYSIPLVPTIISWWLSTSFNKYMLIYYYGLPYSGIFSVAYKIPSVLVVLSNIFSTAWTVSVIKNNEDEDIAEYQKETYNVYNAVNVLVCSLLILLSERLGYLLFSKEFYIAWMCVPFLLIGYLFSGLAAFLAGSFRAIKYTKGLLYTVFAGAIVNVCLNLLVIKSYGMIGAAFTTMIGFAVTLFLRMNVAQKVIGINFNIRRDGFVYLILFVQAFFVVCVDSISRYYSIIFTICVICLYGNIYKNIFKNLYFLLNEKM